MKFATIFAPLLAATYVSAHGILRRMTINGKDFEGNRVGGPKNPSIIRQASTQDPNKGAGNPALICGPNSGPASLVADANPGDVMTFTWLTASDGPWPHNVGPMLTYLASCGSVTCDKFDQAKARWFKIDQVGRKPNSDEWFQNDLKNGGAAKVSLPKNLAPGNYLVRHEIIALHLATSSGGAEFYPGCAQIKVGGSGTGAPKASDLVTIPGAYKDSDPGIFDPSVFDASAKYVFPGPAVAPLVAGAAPAPADPSPASPPAASGSSTSAPASSAPATAPAAPATTSTKSKSCMKKKRALNVTREQTRREEVVARAPEPIEEVVQYRPRHVSRAMRRLAFETTLH